MKYLIIYLLFLIFWAILTFHLTMWITGEIYTHQNLVIYSGGAFYIIGANIVGKQ